MKGQEIKKKSKTPIIAIIIALLAVAGFCYYKCVWLPEDLAKYEIAEETPVATEVIGEVSANDSSLVEIQEGLFNIMEESDATHFTIEFVHEEYNDRYVVTQTDKDSFNEVSLKNVSLLSKDISVGLSTFFNTSYDNFPNGPYDDSDGKTLFGKLCVSSAAQGVIDPQFGNGVKNYFNMHELVLSTSDVKQDKVAFLRDVGDRYLYLFKSSANVVTENCIGDMSKLGFFANRGESKELDIFTLCKYDLNSKDIFLEYMVIK